MFCFSRCEGCSSFERSRGRLEESFCGIKSQTIHKQFGEYFFLGALSEQSELLEYKYNAVKVHIKHKLIWKKSINP